MAHLDVSAACVVGDALADEVDLLADGTVSRRRLVLHAHDARGVARHVQRGPAITKREVPTMGQRL